MDLPLDYGPGRRSAAIGCCGVTSAAALLTGMVTALTVGPACAAGYMAATVVSGASVLLINKLRVSRRLEDHVNLLQSENELLKETNDTFKRVHADLERTHADLERTHADLERTRDSLKTDIEMILTSVKTAGESTEEFMRQLREHYRGIREENDRHRRLNRQQGMFQLVQLFEHFDSDEDFELSTEELRRSEGHLRALFPAFRLDQVDATKRVTLEHLVEIVSSGGGAS